MSAQNQQQSTGLRKADIDLSFITTNMTLEQQVAAYREHYALLYERGVRLVEDLQNEIKKLKEENQKYEKQEEFGIQVIDHLRSQLNYYFNQYPDDPNSINANNQNVMKQYDEMKNNSYELKPSENWRQKYTNERRQSEFLQKEKDMLLTELEQVKVDMENRKIQSENEQAKLINDVNSLWTNQLVEVFQQVEKKGIDISEIHVPTIPELDDEPKTRKISDANKVKEPQAIQNLRKNLVRIYTKTDWNENDLDTLQEEMKKEMATLNKDKINKMTGSFGNFASANDNTRSSDHNNQNQNHYQGLYEDLQKQSEHTILEYKQRIEEQRDIIQEERMKGEIERAKFEEQRKLLIDSKMQLLKSVSDELQHLRDMIRAYNPEHRFRSIMDKVMRYNFPQGDGDTLFQLIHDAGLTEIEFQKRLASKNAKDDKNNNNKNKKSLLICLTLSKKFNNN